MINSIVPLVYRPEFEHPEKDELEVAHEIDDVMSKIRNIVFDDTGHARRSVHSKSHGIIHARLTVLPELPSIFAQGIFSTPGSYDVLMRLSATPGDMLDDNVSTPRGLAIKISEVPGNRLPQSSPENVQDFILVNGPAFLVPTAKAFLKNLKLLAATTDKAEGLKKVLSAALRGIEATIEAAGGKSGKIRSLGGHPETNILGETFFTQAPMLFGPYMAKLSIVPVSANLIALKDQKIDMHNRPDALRETVSEHFRNQSAEWEVRVQLCTDIEKMPIEDSSVLWPEELSPYVAVARISAGPQETWNEDAKSLDDALSFNPWNAVEAHRPIGSIMRVRESVYKHSAAFRAHRNQCPMHMLQQAGSSDISLKDM